MYGVVSRAPFPCVPPHPSSMSPSPPPLPPCGTTMYPCTPPLYAPPLRSGRVLWWREWVGGWWPSSWAKGWLSYRKGRSQDRNSKWLLVLRHTHACTHPFSNVHYKGGLGSSGWDFVELNWVKKRVCMLMLSCFEELYCLLTNLWYYKKLHAVYNELNQRINSSLYQLCGKYISERSENLLALTLVYSKYNYEQTVRVHALQNCNLCALTSA